MKNIVVLSFLFCFFLSCSSDSTDQSNRPGNGSKLFTEVSPDRSNLLFNNIIEENGDVNYFMYTYLYNGGGVGIADINNDNLPDIYLTSTQGKDKLYLNKGDFTFEDISASAGIDKFPGYKTGVTFTDVNDDGWTDIYVCRSGWFSNPDERRNLLFLNKKDNTFTEAAALFGLDDPGRSIQSVFFDYDKDGDLDMYLSNHPKVFRQSVTQVIEKIKNPTPEDSDKFYIKNDDGKYTESGREVGVFNHGYGLGLVTGDMNNDGWTDVYVSNDFQPHDYYYINNGDGTFTESLKDYFSHCSYFAMGVDLVDINNDRNLDIFVGEMLAEDNVRQKTNMAPMDVERFRYLVDNGQHYQYMRNSFHINNGNGYFSDIADYAGIAKTDWSWSSLFGDYDNDGDNDLLIVNGWLKDTQDKDFTIKANAAAQKNNNQLTFEQTASFLKSTRLKNYAFEYEGDLKFKNASQDWGFDFEGFSNGMAYGDLDGDGDLDVVVNNINDNVSLYRNNADGDYVKIQFNGPRRNKFGFNNKVTLYTSEGLQYKEFHITRGFQSSCEPMVHFGLGSNVTIDSLLVEWPNGRMESLTNIEKNKTHIIDYKNAQKTLRAGADLVLKFAEVASGQMIDFTHEEVYYDDYKEEVLLPHQLSQLGPALAVGDVDGNGLDDVYIGGAHKQAGALFIQRENQEFVKQDGGLWSAESEYEDVDALFFDADGDTDLDLYVVSGSNEFLNNNSLLKDRLYINNGLGSFKKDNTLLPEINTSGGEVSAYDYDKDGDEDLFVGGRLVPGEYPLAPKSMLLQNNKDGFLDVTASVAPELENAGMVQSSVWSDYDGDGYTDLIVVGEWMDVLFFKNNGQSFNLSGNVLPKKLVGWWNTVKASDLDGDGDQDFVLGNLGENYKYQATDDEPFEIYSGDFDNNGQRDIVLGYYSDEILFPVRGFQCSSEQIPDLKGKFDSYEAFGKADIFQVYGSALEEAIHYEANCFRSLILWNDGSGNFEIQDLPYEVQLAPVQDIVIHDFNGDQNPDILLAGNWFVSEVETPRADSGTGLLLENQGNRSFDVRSVAESGFFANKDVRKLAYVSCGTNSPLVLTANNNDRLQVFQLN